MYQYFVKVVPTVYKQLSGKVNTCYSDIDQYSSLPDSDTGRAGLVKFKQLTFLNIHSLQYTTCEMALFKIMFRLRSTTEF